MYVAVDLEWLNITYGKAADDITNSRESFVTFLEQALAPFGRAEKAGTATIVFFDAARDFFRVRQHESLRQAGFDVRIGMIAERKSRKTGKIEYIQKGVDVLLTIGVLHESFKGGDDFLLLTGDSDFEPLVRELKGRGARVAVAYKRLVNEALVRAADAAYKLPEVEHGVSCLESDESDRKAREAQ
jgi:uncharacterized LabA/DUF88 family protein